MPPSRSTAIGVKPRDSSSLPLALDDALHSDALLLAPHPAGLPGLAGLAGFGARGAGVLAPPAAAASACSRVSLGVHVRVGSRTLRENIARARESETARA